MAAALVAAIAMQTLFVMALLRAEGRYRTRTHETVLYLPIAKHRSAIAKPNMPAPQRHRHRAPAHNPANAAPHPAPPSSATTAQGLQALHSLLFDCEPNQILSEDDRRRCGRVAGAPRPNAAAGTRIGPERAHDAAHWARALARKQAPVLLPCASPYGIGVSLYTLYCLGKGAIDGFDLDAQPGYSDRARPAHIPNNGDPKPLYQPIHE